MPSWTRPLTDRLARWPIAAALAIPTFGLFIVFNFYPGMVNDLRQAAGGIEPLDGQLGYGPAEVQKLLTTYGSAGRERYRQFLFIDFAFAASYGLFLTALLRLALRRIVSAESRWKDLCLLPLLAGVADCGENLCILLLIRAYPNVPAALAYTASTFTMIKWSAAGLGILSILIAFGLRVIALARTRFRTKSLLMIGIALLLILTSVPLSISETRSFLLFQFAPAQKVMEQESDPAWKSAIRANLIVRQELIQRIEGVGERTPPPLSN